MAVVCSGSQLLQIHQGAKIQFLLSHLRNLPQPSQMNIGVGVPCSADSTLSTPRVEPMEVLTCVKNTFVELADTESPKFEHRRTRSFGCQRDLQFHRLQNASNHISNATLDDIGLHDTAAPAKKKNSESLIQSMLKPGTGTTAVAQLAASLPKGYSLTLTHHGEQAPASSHAAKMEGSKTTNHQPTEKSASAHLQGPDQGQPLQTGQLYAAAGSYSLQAPTRVQNPMWSPAPESVLSSSPATSWQTTHWQAPHVPPPYGVQGAQWSHNSQSMMAAPVLQPAYGPPINSAVAAAAGVASIAMAFRRNCAWPPTCTTYASGAYLAEQPQPCPQASPHSSEALWNPFASLASQGWWSAQVQAGSDLCTSPESSTTAASIVQPAHDAYDHPEEEPSPEEEPELAKPSQPEQQVRTTSTKMTKARKNRAQRPALRAPSRRWCCFKIKMQFDRSFHPVRMIIGKKGDNTRRIAMQTGAKVRIRGRGSGHIEPATGEEAPTPLMMVVSADFDNTEGYFVALDMSLQLLQEVESAYKAHCAATGAKAAFPAVVIGSMCDFTTAQLDGSDCSPSTRPGPYECSF